MTGDDEFEATVLAAVSDGISVAIKDLDAHGIPVVSVDDDGHLASRTKLKDVPIMTTAAKPVWLLDRRLNQGWTLVGKYNTDDEAERAGRRLFGSVWRWWGPEWAARLLIAGENEAVIDAMYKAREAALASLQGTESAS